MPTAAELLAETRRLVAKGWTQTMCKRHESDGRLVYCHALAENVVMFDLLGAADKAADTLGGSVADVIFALDEVAPGGLAMMWQDELGRTQAEVVALVDKARARAEREAA